MSNRTHFASLSHRALRSFPTLVLTLLTVLAVGCGPNEQTCTVFDDDGDGAFTSYGLEAGCDDAGIVDCDDLVATTHPGASEVCNGVDDNCDGQTDEPEAAEDAALWYADADGDGYGDPDTTQIACDQPSLFVDNAEDCDDADADINPDTPWFEDVDGDGYGDPELASGEVGCENPAPELYAPTGDDCDDSETGAGTYPGADEVVNDGIDQDCDGVDSCYRDADHDGFGTDFFVDGADLTCNGEGVSGIDGDCDDGLSTVNPLVTELCDGIDQDCDGEVDDGVQVASYADADTDGYGDADTETWACEVPSDRVADATDCDDASAQAHPDAPEVAANGIDEDCDGGETCQADLDGDGFAGGSLSASADLDCDDAGEGASIDDCNDANATISPAGVEICDGLDQDCDGTVDDGVLITFYQDADADAHGDPAVSTEACAAPSGFVALGDDCDDNEPRAFPGANEVCDEIDDDCDGVIDEGVTNTYYFDWDGDGYGSNTTIQACTAPSGYVENSLDCDDIRSTRFPGATELCNFFDDDCDGLVDEGVTTTYYQDADYDGYAPAAVNPFVACAQPYGYSLVIGDCDDANAAVNPGADELCSTNEVDDDCDNYDEDTDDDMADGYTRYPDGDGDGWGGTATRVCNASQAGYVTFGGDCNDLFSNGGYSDHPGAPEICSDSRDNDCDGTVNDGCP